MKFTKIVLILLFATTVFANPSENRIQEIGLKVNSLEIDTMFNAIDFTTDLKAPTPAGAFFKGNGRYKVAINRSIFDTLSQAAQEFISFHELGHIYLGHTEMDPAIKNRYELELEADVFAAFMYKKFSEQNQDFEDFINFIAQMKQTVPPGEVRASLIRKIISEN